MAAETIDKGPSKLGQPLLEGGVFFGATREAFCWSR